MKLIGHKCLSIDKHVLIPLICAIKCKDTYFKLTLGQLVIVILIFVVDINIPTTAWIVIFQKKFKHYEYTHKNGGINNFGYLYVFISFVIGTYFNEPKKIVFKSNLKTFSFREHF